ncbi:tRNA 4-thiouridine(8) synthase ThiI [bacterium]|nr:tRNA 4-thiouridine(8) synthase ThiI [bacterium]
MNKRAIVLLSGGLDSALALRLLMEQGIDVIAVHFVSPFFRSSWAVRLAQEWNVPLVEIDITEDILKLLKSPPHGFGSQMNPCIDCHALMLRKAKELMEKFNASFVATGEVLGERPMSQNKGSLRIVEKESGLEGLLLRPLSAKLLPPTIPEKEGLVDREKLLDIKGRSRKIQMELVDRFGIKDYPSPAGGCLLTDPQFAKRLKDLMDNDELSKDNVNLLKIGRHFRLGKGLKLVVGRNKEENQKLKELVREDDVFLEAISHKGPDAILRGQVSEEDVELAGRILARYSDLGEGEKLRVKVSRKGEERMIEVDKLEEKEIRKWMI